MLTCAINSFTLSVFALVYNNSKLLWNLLNTKHTLSVKMSNKYGKKLYPLYQRNGLNLLQLAYKNANFQVFDNLVKTTSDTRVRYSYIEGLLRKALLIEQDYEKACKLIKLIKKDCNNINQKSHLVHPCNVISIYDQEVDPLYLTFVPVKNCIDKPVGNYRIHISGETYEEIVEFLIVEFIENQLITIDQLYEIFKFACCYDKNNVAEIVMRVSNMKKMSFVEKYKMEEVFVELCGSPYIKLFTVQWFYGTYIRNDHSFDMNTMFAQAIKNVLCRNDEYQIAEWLLKMADEMSISINLTGDDYSITKEIIYRNPDLFDWYANVCKIRQVDLEFSDIGFDIIEHCVIEKLDNSLCMFLNYLRKVLSLGHFVKILSYDAYMLERKLFERIIGLMTKTNKEMMEYARTKRSFLGFKKSKKRDMKLKMTDDYIISINLDVSQEYQTITKIYDVLYGQCIGESNIKTYVMDRNAYLRTLYYHMTNNQAEVKEVGFEICSICQGNKSLLMVEDNRNKTKSLRCSECNKRFMNRNMTVEEIIVRCKGDFEEDFSKYSSWYDGLSDTGYTILIGKFDFVKEANSNQQNEFNKLMNIYSYINLGI
jgi:hypothetical protein